MSQVAKAKRSLDGSIVVSTGAARGIGLATAQALLRRGAQVVIGDRTERMAQAVYGRDTALPAMLSAAIGHG